MKILLVTYIYQPDNGPSASLFALLCEELAKRGHEITVIATVPHYPSGFVQASYRTKWIQHSMENGVRVIRVRVPSLNRKKFTNRLLQFLFFQVGSSLTGWRETSDIVIVTNPALNKGLAFFALAKLQKKPSIFLVSDVYPDVGIETGVFRHPAIIQFVETIERCCIHNADLVWSFSDSFLKRLYTLGADPERVDVLGAWVDTDFFRPLPKDNTFAQEHKLIEKFVILYAGNLGLSQGLEQFLFVAQDLQDHSTLQFVFVGDGTGRDTLIEQANSLRLQNVKFIPFQPWERVPEVLATADISVISLRTGIGMQSLPSKTFSYLASGRAILAIVDPDSAVWHLIHKSNSGICIPYGEPDAIKTVILDLFQHPEKRQAMGENARSWAVANHSVHHAADRILQMAEKAIQIHTIRESK